MSYIGDFAVGAQFPIRFYTEDQTGLPVTMTGAAFQARKGSGAGSTSTAGLTLTANVVTGQHVLDVDFTADGAFYASASEISIEFTAGTIEGVAQAGKVLRSFSIQNRYALTAAAIRAALGLSSANMDTQLAAIGTKTANLPASPAATGDAMTLTAGERNSIADAHLDRANAIEAGITPRQAQRIDLAANSGKTSGPVPGTAGTVNIRDTADTKNRVSATVDENGYRTAVTLDGA